MGLVYENAVERYVSVLSKVVLIVDDDEAFRKVLHDELVERGFTVVEAGTGSEALTAASERQPDAVLLDLGLPDVSGLDLLGQLHRSFRVPVIVVSGRGGEVDRCVGLENGADDYLVKPFSFRELAIRLEHVIGNAELSKELVVANGSLIINLDTRDVFDGERQIDLTAKEFDLLALLASSPRRVFSRAQILERVWGSSLDWQSSGTISEHIHRVRRKLDPDGRSTWIQTMRGLGYRFNPDASEPVRRRERST